MVRLRLVVPSAGASEYCAYISPVRDMTCKPAPCRPPRNISVTKRVDAIVVCGGVPARS